MIMSSSVALIPQFQNRQYTKQYDLYAALYNHGCLWNDLLKLFELTIAMRRQDDVSVLMCESI